MDDKKYILEIAADSVSIINTECGMRETTESSPFIERIALLVQKDLISVAEFTPSWEKGKKRERKQASAE